MASAPVQTATIVFTVAYEVLVGDNTELLGDALREAVEAAVGPAVEGTVLFSDFRSETLAAVVPTFPVAGLAGRGAPQPAPFRTRWNLHQRP